MQTRGSLLKISAILTILICLSGCGSSGKQSVSDFLRTLAGRPTSAEIASKRAAIDKIQSAKALRVEMLRIADSLAAVSARDSLVIDSLKSAGVLNPMTNEVDWSSDTDTDTLARKYYIMVGVFSVKSNAENQARRAFDSGYEPTLVRFCNGRHAVVLNGSDLLSEILPVFDSVRTEAFCPKEAWILYKN